MRKLFLLLLIINILLFGYSQFTDNNEQTADSQITADIGELKLVQLNTDPTQSNADKTPIQLGDNNAQAQDDAATDVEKPLRLWTSSIGNCGIVTPIDDAQKLISLVKQLNELKIASLQSEKQTTHLLYRVVILPLENIQLAKQKLNKLAQSGFPDVWLISHGPLTNAISLGVFKDEVRAKNYANRLKTRGFSVDIQPMEKIDDFYELTFDVTQATNSALNTLVEQWQTDLTLHVFMTDCVDL